MGMFGVPIEIRATVMWHRNPSVVDIDKLKSADYPRAWPPQRLSHNDGMFRAYFIVLIQPDKAVFGLAAAHPKSQLGAVALFG